MDEPTVVLWRDIPAQVTLGAGRGAARAALPGRFAEAIDRAAMRGGARDEDAYLGGWRRVPAGEVVGPPLPTGQDAATLVAAVAARIDTSWDEERLRAAAMAGGRDARRTAETGA